MIPLGLKLSLKNKKKKKKTGGKKKYEANWSPQVTALRPE